MEALAYNPKCPAFAKTIIYKVTLFLTQKQNIKNISLKAIGLAVSLAPQMEVSQ